MHRIINLKTFKKIKMFFILIFLSCIGIMLYYITPFFTGYLIDNIISEKNISHLKVWVILSIIFSISMHSYIFYFLKYLWSKHGFLSSKEIRENIVNKILNLFNSDYNDFENSFIFNIIISDSSTAGSIIINYICSIAVSIFRILLCLVILFSINLKLTLIGLIFIPIYMGAIFLNKNKLKQISLEEREATDDYISFVDTIINGKKHINLFREEKFFKEIYNQKMDLWTEKRLKYKFFLSLTREIPQFISTLAPFIILAYGSKLVIANTLSLGSLVMFSQYLNMLFEPLSILTRVSVEKKSTKPIFDRLDKFINHKSTSKDGYLNLLNEDKNLLLINNYDIYNKNNDLLFKVDNLTITNRGVYLIQGDNGTGKTTLFNLLTGINDVNSIKPNGDSFKFQILKTLYDNFSYLYNPGFLFSGTVEENITFDNINNTRLKEICKILMIKDLDKEVTLNPINLSLGEQQKIFLARTFFYDKDIILLDEPTSNLDSQVKCNLINYIESIKNNKTILIISHDSSLESIADSIFKIEDKEIIDTKNNR
ncbi:ABC transporter transmembrane domain-containing protein [Dethiothermospora halolimnae]|uniref:ABC transporter transmembrane domain-containing protein n=1 Tax=Dethiothermospora halolimnae TaxID=3114390 RepID=UPI003CCB8C47